MMAVASRLVRDLLLVVDAYSLHEGRAASGLSCFSVGWAGLFDQLKEGGDCKTATAEAALDWFDAHWPIDLQWPKSVARPFQIPGNCGLMAEGFSEKVASEDASFLVRISHAPVWANGRRPPWWGNLEIREFLTRTHRQLRLLDVKAEGDVRFGDAFPSISAIQRFWARLDEIQRAADVRDIPRPRKKKEAA
jgi:hypothetical protein